MEAIDEYRKRLKACLDAEVAANGGSYRKWHDDLSGFRDYMMRRYIRRRFGRELYWHRFVQGAAGDLLDHHTVSYFAPLEFKRIGWGGRLLTPQEQVGMLSDCLTRGGGRFVYVCLPNKGAVYPDLICDEPGLYQGHTCVAPQWRKYVADFLQTDVEILDMYPVFRDWVAEHGRSEPLFAKEHNISSTGAKLVADAIADYLGKTMPSLPRRAKVSQRRILVHDRSLAVEECLYLNYDENDMAYGFRGPVDSDIAIFGDCNLQSYSHLGAGITGSLAYSLQYPVFDAGRMLVFDDNRVEDNVMSVDALRALKSKSLVIYVAFASAPFTRTSETTRKEVLRRLSFKNYKWCNFELP